MAAGALSSVVGFTSKDLIGVASRTPAFLAPVIPRNTEVIAVPEGGSARLYGTASSTGGSETIPR